MSDLEKALGAMLYLIDSDPDPIARRRTIADLAAKAAAGERLARAVSQIIEHAPLDPKVRGHLKAAFDSYVREASSLEGPRHE